jgi:hypothetical protein
MREYTPSGAEPQGVLGYRPPPSNSGKAIASMIIGIAGTVIGLPLFCLSGLCTAGVMAPCAIVSLILGYMAKREINESGGAIGGGGMATTGIVLGWIDAGLAVIIFVLGVLGIIGLIGWSLLSQH